MSRHMNQDMLIEHPPPLIHLLVNKRHLRQEEEKEEEEEDEEEEKDLLTDAVGGTLATPISSPSSHWGAAPLAPCTTSDESRTVRSLH